MNEMSLSYKLKQLKESWPNMTGRERLEHLWAYYKWVILVVLAVILGVSFLVNAIIQKNKQTVISGVALNVTVSEEGRTYLQQGYKEHFELTSWKQQVLFRKMQITEGSENVADSYDNLMNFAAMCSQKEVDYLLLNTGALDSLYPEGALKDLRQVYTQEELDNMGDVVVYKKDKKTEEMIPVALNITDSAFVKENISQKGNIYFGFVTNTPRLEQAKQMYEFILALKAEA